MYFFELSPSPNSERTFDNKVDFFSRFSSQIQSNLIDVNFDHGSDFPKKKSFQESDRIKVQFWVSKYIILFILFTLELYYGLKKDRSL